MTQDKKSPWAAINKFFFQLSLLGFVTLGLLTTVYRAKFLSLHEELDVTVAGLTEQILRVPSVMCAAVVCGLLILLISKEHLRFKGVVFVINLIYVASVMFFSRVFFSDLFRGFFTFINKPSVYN